jgi:acyl CoA:acetate/3-ketoacid CoA transferase
MKNKIVSAAEAVAIIRDGDTIACSGFVGSGTPDELIVALEQRFVETGSPRDLTLVFAAGPGDGKERGLNRLARMVRYMETHYHTTASRYTTSAFLRLKLGEALSHRRVAPHIFETWVEAHAFVQSADVKGPPGPAA